MKFRLEIACDNAAFGETHLERVREIARIVGEAIDHLTNGDMGGGMYDENGNRVGAFKLDAA
ncbi:MAG TPA: hypothetical protein VGG68_00780 [Caulobacteraceae bacterium]